MGDPAPDFTLTTSDGRALSLADYRGRSEVVLFFYPKDATPGCTAEACSFRDRYEDFQAVGAAVVGVSSDSVDSHRRFRDRHRLPFDLVSDPGGTLRARYGVPKTLGLFPGRSTYLIDRDGIVRHVFHSQLNPHGHVSQMLEKLKELRAATEG